MVSPNNSFSDALDRLRTLVAKSAEFQDWTGTANEAAAKALVYIHGFDTSLNGPLAVVSWAPPFRWVRERVNGANPFRLDGDLALYFTAPADTAATDTNAAMTFTNRLGTIIQEMGAVSWADVRLNVQEYELDTLRRTRPDEANGDLGDYWEAAFRVAVRLGK